MDYGFFAIRSMMWIVGLWPVQRNSVIYTIQWLVVFAIGVSDYVEHFVLYVFKRSNNLLEFLLIRLKNVVPDKHINISVENLKKKRESNLFYTFYVIEKQ